MYPDLSYFFHDVFGTAVDNWSSMFKTFGIFLALTFFSAFILIRKELRRKEADGSIPQLSSISKGSSLFSETFFNAILDTRFRISIKTLQPLKPILLKFYLQKKAT